MEDQSSQTPEAAPQEAARPHRRYWRRRLIWRGVFLLLAAPVVALLLGAFLLIGREVTAPSWLVHKVETRAEEALAGGSLDFGALKIIVGDDLHPRIVLRNAVLRDKDGMVLARVPRIESLLSPRGALQGRVLAQEVRLEGAQIQLRRREDGTVAVAFDSAGGDVRSAENFLALIDQIDQAFETGALEALEQVQAEGLIINYLDARAGRNWTVDDGRIELDLRDRATILRGSIALLSGRNYVTTAELSYTSPRGSGAAELGVTITDAAAPDIASQTPLLSWLGVLEAPISGAMRGVLAADGSLTNVSATLQIGAGELKPNDATRPIPFEGGRTYLSFDPQAEKLTFDLIEVTSDWGRMSGTGHAYLREFEAGWPGAILGQVSMDTLEINPADLYDTPQTIGAATADFRLRLDPFSLDIGQAVLRNAGNPVLVSGDVVATPEGWSVALQGQAERLPTGRVMALWPEALRPENRQWYADNLLAGDLRNVAVAFRARPGQAPESGFTGEFEEAVIRVVPGQPPISGAAGVMSLLEKRFAMTLFEGHIAADQGGQIDLAGSRMLVPQTGRHAPARFDMNVAGSITGVMSVLSTSPFNVLANSDLPVALADGRVRGQVALDTPLGKGVRADQRVWSTEARLSNLRSEVLVPGQVLSSSGLDLRADAESLVIQGPAQVGDITGRMVFSRALGPGSEGTARVEGEVELTQAFLDTFNIALPPGTFSGRGTGQLALDLSEPGAPSFRLTSDLSGIGLQLPAIGWAKGRNSNGELIVEGGLGSTPRIDRLRLDAAGLSADGTIRLASGGGLERAGFDRVRIGNWFDAPVVLLGRGQGRPVAVQIAGGTLDLRRADFGSGGDQGGPMEIALDRLQVSEGIALTDFRGNFTSRGGFSGEFTGNINDAAAVRGTVVPINGRTGVRILGDDAGAVFRASGLLRNAHGGSFDLTLRPAGGEGSYDGNLTARNLRVRDAPALATLLDAVSVVGLLNQLTGQGLLFDDVDAAFRLTPTQVIVTQSSAVGPGLGISLDGIYTMASEQMDFQGVVSPFYLLNGIGSVLTRPGEGLIGFNFNLRGSVDSPRVTVNPLSALTPGMFREIFRRQPPTVSQ